MKLLEINHVEKSFDDLNVLKDISLSVEDGEIVSIIGPSGSGKSTLMNIIGCLDTADEGTYYLDGQEIDDYSEDELKTFEKVLHSLNRHIEKREETKL